MKKYFYLFVLCICISSPVCYGAALWKEDAGSKAMIHTASEFRFPSEAGDFKRVRLIEGKNTYHGSASGIIYEVPAKGVEIEFILVPKSIKPEPQASELFFLSLTTQDNIGAENHIQEITPPKYGNPSERLAAFVLLDKTRNTGMFSFVLADRGHLISMKVFHTLDTDSKWMAAQIDVFLKSLNWSL